MGIRSLDILDCPTGMHNEGHAARLCEDCTLNVDFQDEEGQESCKILTDCFPGFRVSRLPSISIDRECEACLPETISEVVNALGCIQCPAGTNQPDPGQSTCYTNLGCPAGFRSEASVCIQCLPGTFQDEIGQSSCKPVTTCPLGWFISVHSTFTTDTDCDPCPAGSYSDSVDSDSCTTCTVGTDYQVNAGQVMCTPLQRCLPGEMVTATPTITSDRLCSVCVAGTFSATNNSASCEPCQEGHYSLPHSSACLAHTTCAGSELEIVAPSAVQDRVCEEIITCSKGQRIVVDLDTTLRRNRECEDCLPGSMSDTINSPDCISCVETVSYQPQPGKPQCYAVRLCRPGQFMKEDATLINNRVCRNCDKGEVSNGTNVESCTPCDGTLNYSPITAGYVCLATTTCHFGEYVVREPTRSADRVCGQCPAGFVTAVQNSPECQSCDGINNYSPVVGGTICLPMTPSCGVDEVEVSIQISENMCSSIARFVNWLLTLAAFPTLSAGCFRICNYRSRVSSMSRSG